MLLLLQSSIQTSNCKFSFGFFYIQKDQLSITLGSKSCNIESPFKTKVYFSDEYIFGRNLSEQQFSTIFYNSNLISGQYYYQFQNKYKNKLCEKIKFQYLDSEDNILNDQSVVVLNINWEFWLIILTLAIIILILIYFCVKCCKVKQLQKQKAEAKNTEKAEKMKKYQSLIFTENKNQNLYQQKRIRNMSSNNLQTKQAKPAIQTQQDDQIQQQNQLQTAFDIF